MNPPTHTRFIIGCITFLAGISALCGAWLLWKGFAGGGELVMTVNTAIAGMIGYLSNKQTQPPTGPGGGIQVEGTPEPSRPVHTEPDKPAEPEKP